MSNIALAGKGGSGKTTLSGLLARSLARRGHTVWAIDADSNPNLGLSLGIPRERLGEIPPLPRSILKERTDEAGKRTMTLGMPAREVVATYGIPTPDGVVLLLMGTVDHAGAGWLCSAHAAVRHLLNGLLEEKQVVTVVDMEAGLEHLSRGTGRHVDTLLVVMEPYYKALETARRCAELGRELGIPQVLAVANKLRGEEDRTAVRHYAAAHGMDLVSEVPFDSDVYGADQSGIAPELAPDSVATRAIDSLTAALKLSEPRPWPETWFDRFSRNAARISLTRRSVMIRVLNMRNANRFRLSLLATLGATLLWPSSGFAWGDGPCAWGGTTETVVSTYFWSSLLWWALPLLMLTGLAFTWRWARRQQYRSPINPGVVSSWLSSGPRA